MKTNLAFGSVVCGGIAAGSFAFACSSDTINGVRPADAGTEASTGGSTSAGGARTEAGGTSSGGTSSGGTSSGGTSAGGTSAGGTSSGGAVATDGGGDGGIELSLCGGKTRQAQIDCGAYIVRHIDACGDCHSPTDPATGGPDPAKFLQGNATRFDIAPGDTATGSIPAPNLTLLKSQGWTLADIKDAVLNGERTARGRNGIFPLMPYFTFHNMAPADAEAIAAYLLSVPASGSPMPGRQPLPAPLSAASFPIPPIPKSVLPNSTLPTTDAHYADAQRGKYLAAELGVCVECHTEHTSTGSLDTAKLFAGGEKVPMGGLFGTVVSPNITPANNGIKGWTPATVATLLLTGVDDEGVKICPAMPAGPLGSFGGMAPNDALAIGYYVTSLPAIENPADGGPSGTCVFPAPPPSDGGLDASLPKGAATGG